MLKLLFRFLFILILGGLAYDIMQNGSFQKSKTYKYMKDIGAIDNGEVILKEAKKSFHKASVWAEKNIPVYYNETCVRLKPYIKLSYDLGMTFKSNAVSLMQQIIIYVDKNFPSLQNNVSIMLTETVTLARKSLVVISAHLENYTLSAVEYANNMFGS